MQKNILFITFFLLSINIIAQTIEWENTIGGNDIEWNDFIQRTNDGNAILGGYSYSNISGDKNENSKGLGDFWLIKLDVNSGNIIWQKTIGGNSFDHLTSGFETIDGGYILGGYSSSNISGDKTENSRGGDDYWIVRLDSNRNIIWQKTFGGNGLDRLTSIISTNDGGYLISGDSESSISGDKNSSSFGLTDIWVVKIDSIGNIEWQKTFGGNQSDFESKLLKLINNTYILSGSSSSDISGNKTQNSHGLGDYWILNLDLNGNIIWQKTIGGNNGDYASSIVETSDSNFIIAGYSNSGISGDKTQISNGSTDIWLLKLNSANGNIIWQKDIGGNSTDWQPEIKKTHDDNFIILTMSASDISGQKTEANKGDRDYWLIKIDSNGGIVWDKTIGGNSTDEPQSIIEINPNQFICSGWSQSNASGDKSENKMGLQDNWVIKINNCSSNNSIYNNQTTCINQTLYLSANVGVSYSWTGPNGFTSNMQNPIISNVNLTHNGIYICNILQTGNCNLIQNVTVQIQNTLAPTGNATQSFCSTQNATLADIVVSGTNINWYNSATSTALFPSTTLLVNGSTYYATQTVSGCESVGRLSVTISLINTLNATDYSETLCDNLNDGFENLNLINYQPNLITNTSGCTFEYYNSQNGANNQIATDKITNTSNYNLTVGSHIIYIRITSTNTCHQIVKLNLDLFSNPVITIPNIVPLCDKSNVSVDAGSGFTSYQWSTGATTQTILITQAGNYNVTVNQNHGSIVCLSTKNFQVVPSNIATILNIETIDMSSDEENIIMVNLDTNSLGDYEYSIDGIHYQDSNTFTNLSGGDYSIYVKDKNGCGIIKDEVFILTYPKFFTPNGDGYNDTWKIKFSEIENGLTVKIFDRYGKLLKTLDNKKAWDGTYNSNMMISDDYWFVINRANGKEHRGHFTLKR